MFRSAILFLALAVPSLPLGSASPTTSKKASPVPVADRDVVGSEQGLSKRATYNGMRATYYDTDVGLGSCGILHQNSEYTVAMNSAQMSDSACGQTITISYNGKTTQAGVWDTCPGCPYGGLDLSEGLFSFFASQDAGVIYVDWSWGSSNSDPTTSSTYQAPTTSSYTPTSTYTPPESTSTYTPPTSTYVAPTSTYQAPSSTSVSPTSTYVAPTSSSTPVESSSMTPTTSPTGSATASSSILASGATESTSLTSASASTITPLTTLADSPFVTQTLSDSATATASASAVSTGVGSTSEPIATVGGGNLNLLSDMIVNLGKLVVITGQGF